MKRLMMALLIAAALPHAAAAKDAFKNLPGVKDPAQQEDVDLGLDCDSRLVQAWPSRFPQRNGLAERAYSCNDGGSVSIGSNRAPNLIEYRKFKEYYRNR